jgi:hypothetical protein
VLNNSLKIFLVDDDHACHCLLGQKVGHYGHPDVLRVIQRFGPDSYLRRERHLHRKAPSGRDIVVFFNALLAVTRFFL